MVLKLVRWLVRGRKRPTTAIREEDGTEQVSEAGSCDVQAAAVHQNDWRAILTAPIAQVCEAPSADTVRFAFSLYAEDVYAPFAAREARMAELLTRIRAGIAGLTAGAPGLVESALAEHSQVFAELRRLQSGGKP